MIISGVNNSQNYSFFNVNQSGNQKTPEALTTDKYVPTTSSTSATYNMFGNIQKSIFDSFTNENSFMSAIRTVFDNVENQALSSETLTQAAKISDEFKKKGEWLSISPDGKHVSIRDAENVYYEGKEQSISVSNSDNVVLNATKGKKEINIFGSKNVVSNTGEGSDRLFANNSSNVIINSGGGNDGIGVIRSKNVLINSGNGDDRVFSSGSSGVAIKSGKGNDIITVGNSNSIIIDSGDGNDKTTLYSSDSVNINNGDGNDTTSAISSENLIIDGGKGDDIINVQHSSNVIVDGGDGDDVITVEHSSNVIVDGGAGNDTITASGIISGGTGDDYIKLHHSIFLKDEKIQDVIKYSKGDGNDIVEGVTEDTIIELNGISEDEYDITESRNENGTKVKTLTMKDGSGSMTLIYNGSTYSNHVKKQDNAEQYSNMPEYTRLNNVSVGQAD
ncbi:calcium-binding protein [Seleniivibrio woodruffii]|uniref:calcium-binding protein n=1 Tax=Seleniivibrio woodruffii TaxID=1078050 RepID=UPI0026EA4EE3|nr:calcium-binding protein [Seleniivibrio woodruffii]